MMEIRDVPVFGGLVNHRADLIVVPSRRAFCLGAIAALAATRIVRGAADGSQPSESTKPTLFIAGDSTVRNGTKGQQGWGERLGELFDTSRINVVNRAIGGRSSRTFITEGRWDQLLKDAKPGDFVLIQFGHNDGIAPDDPQRPRGTLRGIGEETKDIVHPQTKKPETVHTYGWYLRRYVADAKAKGMTPIICSPVPRRPKEPVTEPLPAPSSYPMWAEEVAKAERVSFIDLHRLILHRYVGLAPDEIKRRYFTATDDTHTCPDGAALNAEVVAGGIAGLTDVKLAQYLLESRSKSASTADGK
jgi:lysophospholipase L1-like esterase